MLFLVHMGTLGWERIIENLTSSTNYIPGWGRGLDIHTREYNKFYPRLKVCISRTSKLIHASREQWLWGRDVAPSLGPVDGGEGLHGGAPG